MTDKELLQELMNLNNWPQRALSKELGLKVHSHVSKVMNDKGNLSGSSRRLAEKLLKESQ